MAKQVKSPIPDNLFDKAIAGANAFLAKMQEIIGAFKKIGTQAKTSLNQIDFSKAEGVSELNKQLKDLEGNVKALETVKKEQLKTQKAVDTIRKEEAKVTKQLIGLTDEEVKGKIRFQAANKKQRDELKALIALEDKQVGTLEKLNAANTLLRIERSKLNAEIPEQRQRFESLNAEIDANNEKIDELSDKQKTARQNVGNYTESINEALMSSGAFTSATSELSEVQGILSAIMKVSSRALRKNEDQVKDTSKATTRMGRASQKAGRLLKAGLVGALAIAGAAMGAFVTKTQEGQSALETITKQALGTSNVILGRLIELGKGLLTFGGLGVQGIGLAFKEAFRPGLADDIKNVNAAVSELVKTQFQAANAARAVQADIERRIQLEEDCARSSTTIPEALGSDKRRRLSLQKYF